MSDLGTGFLFLLLIGVFLLWFAFSPNFNAFMGRILGNSTNWVNTKKTQYTPKGNGGGSYGAR